MSKPDDWCDLVGMLKRHEGLRLHAYKDSEGVPTIGYGHNLEEGIPGEVAELLLAGDMRVAVGIVERVFGRGVWDWLAKARENALIDMAFNLGEPRFRSFKRMIAAVKAQDWERAADEMLDSKWAGQVGERADELAAMMREG